MAVKNIGAQRIVEQDHVLRHQAQTGAQTVLLDIAQIMPVDQNAPGRRVVKPEDEFQEGRFAGSGRATHADKTACRNVKTDAINRAFAAIMGKFNIFEADFPARDRYVLRVLGISDIGFQGECLIDAFEIDCRLFDLAIGPTQNIQGLVDIHQDHRDRCDIAWCQHAIPGFPARHQCHGEQTAIHNQRLQPVQKCQRGLGPGRSIGIILQRIIIALRFSGFGSESLYRFKIDQRIDRTRIGLIVGLIHDPAQLDPPFSHREGRQRIQRDGDHCDGRELPAIGHTHHAGREQQFEYGRADIKDQKAQQKINRSRAAINDPVQRAGAFGLMEIERQALNMPKGAHRDKALNILANGCKQRVAQLRRAHAHKARTGIQQEGNDESRGRRIACAFGDRIDAIAKIQRRSNRKPF